MMPRQMYLSASLKEAAKEGVYEGTLTFQNEQNRKKEFKFISSNKKFPATYLEIEYSESNDKKFTVHGRTTDEIMTGLRRSQNILVSKSFKIISSMMDEARKISLTKKEKDKLDIKSVTLSLEHPFVMLEEDYKYLFNEN